MDNAKNWHLMKYEDGTVFGPISLVQLREWASSAQISPFDRVSSDGESWIKAPMLPDLKMDWLVQVDSEHYYGPTTVGALLEFISVGEINDDTTVINCCDGSQSKITELDELDQLRKAQAEAQAQAEADDEEEEDEPIQQPVRTSIRANLQRRIRELEVALMDERRAKEQLEERFHKLEERYDNLRERYLDETGKPTS